MDEKQAEIIDYGITPEGEPLYEVDVHITASALYDYFLRHEYTSIRGLVGTVFGVILIYFALSADVPTEYRIMYFLFACIVILYLPVKLFMTAKQQSLTPGFKQPLHFAFYENGMQISQGRQQQMCGWDGILKAVSTSKSFILYTGPNSASIFPRKDIGEQAESFLRVIFAHVDPKRMKIKQ